MNVFTDELKKHIELNLVENSDITNSMHGGLHYTHEMDKTIEDYDYKECKNNFIKILEKTSEGKAAISLIKFYKNFRFIRSGINEQERLKRYSQTVDILIIPDNEDTKYLQERKDEII